MRTKTAAALRIKTYYTSSIEKAMEQARQELGSEAMLLICRRSVGAGQQLGDYEVSFAVAPEAPEAPDAPATSDRATPSIPPGAIVTRQRIEIPAPRVDAARPTQPLSRYKDASSIDPELTANGVSLYVRLVDNEVPAAAALDVALAVQAQVPHDAPPAQVDSVLEEELAGRLKGAAGGWNEPKGYTAALIGPAGAGKTSLALKLALRYRAEAARPVELWSLEGEQPGASARMACFAVLHGLPYRQFDSVSALYEACKRSSYGRLLLIDTPGFSRAATAESGKLAECFKDFPPVAIHLVLPASLRPDELERAASAFGQFPLASLMYTRLDETPVFGALWQQSVQRKLGVSFFAAGQRIPQDLILATPRRLAQLVTRTVRKDTRN